MIPRFLFEYSSFDEVLFDLVRLGYTASINGSAQGGQFFFAGAAKPEQFSSLLIYPFVGQVTGAVYARYTPGHPKAEWELFECYSGKDSKELDRFKTTLEQLPDACCAWVESWEAR